MTDEAIGPADKQYPIFEAVGAAVPEFTDGPEQMDSSRLVDLDRWRTEPDEADLELFVDPCTGPTLDVGCGPGRLAAELTAREVMAVGIDVADDAVRLARRRGAQAVRRDVFAEVPGEQHWQHVLLADGNIGIGGDPAALLARISELMVPDGEIITEVAESGIGIRYIMHRLRIGERVVGPFPWAVVGLDAVDGLADEVGLSVKETRCAGGRLAVTFAR